MTDAAQFLTKNITYKSLEAHLTERFGATAGAAVYAAFAAELERLLPLHKGDAPAKSRHTCDYIVPAIALYRALSSTMPQPEAAAETEAFLAVVTARTAHALRRLLRIPFLHRFAPYHIGRILEKYFGADAGFTIHYLQKRGGTLRFDVIACPYAATCQRHGCRELVPIFCRLDDILLGTLHPQLLWRRNQTIGCGGNLCDFEISRRDRPFDARRRAL